MSASSQKIVRRVVPRWHSLSDAFQSNELDPSVQRGNKLEASPFLAEKERKWLEDPQLFSALDLVNAARVLGESPHANDAARYILAQKIGVSEMAREMATNQIGDTEPAVLSTEKLAPPELRRRIKIEKERRKVEPRNAFVWCELARLYVLLGMPEKARLPMEIAISLAPRDRFVVRSATRFFLHLGEPERALGLLRNCESTSSDPWLLAAEVAVSSVAEKTPRFTKQADQLISDKNISPLHTSELLAALASLEMWSGNDKKAKRLFLDTLKAPTENALAQVIWATDDLGFPDLSRKAEQIPNAFEAQALDSHNKGHWEMTIAQCDSWSGVEAFSSRPYAMASSVASSILKKHPQAIEIATGGLATNPTHPGLLNNIAFSLAESGKPREALAEIEKVDLSKSDLASTICLVATGGLIEYRLGNATEGRALYEKAIMISGMHGQLKLKATAQIYLAREEARLGFSNFGQLFDSGRKELNKGNDAFANALVGVIGREITEFSVKAAADA